MSKLILLHASLHAPLLSNKCLLPSTCPLFPLLKSPSSPSFIHLLSLCSKLFSLSLQNSTYHCRTTMAEQRGQYEQERQQRLTDPIKGLLPGSEKGSGPSKSKILAVVTLLPVGGVLLLLAGLTLAGTLLGLAVTTPLFIIFSPVLVPASLTIALATAGFLTSGAFGITALSALSWMVNYLRGACVPEQLEHAKRRAQEAAGQVGQKAREVGRKVPETART